MKIYSIQSANQWKRYFTAMAMTVLLLSATVLSQYANPTTVDLLTASNYRVLAGTAITIGVGTTITGDVGVSPGATVTNNGTVTGVTHLNDASAVQAQTDLSAAFSNAAGRSVDETVASELGGTVLGRGVYTSAAGTFGITGNLTLNGSASDIFIFKMATTLTTAIGSSVTLTGGALASNVFWQVGSSATIDGNFKGNILALTAVTQNTSATIDGRVLARNSFVTVSGNSVLPVELSSFIAAVNGGNAELRWTTATEVNNFGFELQRSAISVQQSEKSWMKIGFIDGNGTTNSPKEYSFIDNTVPIGKYSYRLKQIDRDGKFTYSQSVEAMITAAPKALALMQNYPNPFNPSTTIRYSLPSASPVTLRIFSMLGQEAAVLVNAVQQAGEYEAKFNASALASGLYIYRIQAGSTVEIKRMQLLK